VSIVEIVAMMRRQVIGVGLVCVLALGLAYHLLHLDPGYSDTGTIAITAPKAWGQQNAFTDVEDLLTTEEVLGWYVMGPQGQQAVRTAGGTASYDVAFKNDYTQQYPSYSEPYLIVTVTSPDPGRAEATFNAVIKVIESNAATRQLQLGANQRYLVVASPAGAPSGPVANKGSRTRVVAGLLVLAIIAVAATAAFLDRCRIRWLTLPRKGLAS
jgi:hypothetical protein